MLLAILLVAACMGGGMLLKTFLPRFDGLPLCLILACAFLLLCVVNRAGAVSFARRRFGMSAEERSQWLQDERTAAAEADPDVLIRELGAVSLLPVSLMILYWVLALSMSLGWGMASVSPEVKLIASPLFCYLLFMPIFRRIQLTRERLHKTALVPEDDMKQIHALAQKAAHAAGLLGKVRLELNFDADIAIKRYGRIYLVFLGTRALAVMSEDELYAAILRECLYYADPKLDRTLHRYDRFASLGAARPRMGTYLFDVFYAPADVYMEWVMIYYKLAVSRKVDGMAAAYLRREGYAPASLSARIKQDMWEYFDHEWYRHLTESVYAHADTPTDYEFAICDAYRKAMEARYPTWLRLVTHGLPRQYYVGVSLEEHGRMLCVNPEELPDTPVFPSIDTPLGRECMRPTIQASPATIARYQKARHDHYEKPCEIIAAWEAGAQNQPSYELSPILNAYLSLHRTRDVEMLCDRILEDEPDFAHALYFKGCCLLQRYETEGIDCIYRAIDINKNYMDDGFDLIESYCRLMGLSDERQTLLRRQENTLEAHAAEHDDAATLRPSDHLVKETELDAELPAMLDYMAAAGGGCIARIYLVRKVISDDFFTSAFVIAFAPDAAREDMDAAYSAIFHYLDAADWQYSLFIYDRNIAEALRKVPDSLIWERDS